MYYFFIVIVALYSALLLVFFFFNDTATTEIYTLSLHDALPIYTLVEQRHARDFVRIAEGDDVLLDQRVEGALHRVPARSHVPVHRLARFGARLGRRLRAVAVEAERHRRGPVTASRGEEALPPLGEAARHLRHGFGARVRDEHGREAPGADAWRPV